MKEYLRQGDQKNGSILKTTKTSSSNETAKSVPSKTLEKKNMTDDVTSPGNNTNRSMLDTVDSPKSSFAENIINKV